MFYAVGNSQGGAQLIKLCAKFGGILRWRYALFWVRAQQVGNSYVWCRKLGGWFFLTDVTRGGLGVEMLYVVGASPGGALLITMCGKFGGV